MSADKLLTDAAQIMQERAKQYDSPTGERSMGKAVAAFNCVTGKKMTEAEGWLLLQLLKDVRQWTTPNVAHVDSLQDCIAYAALKAECIIEKTASDVEWQDKELPSSGIYGDAGYSDQDMQAASLVHDCDLDEQRDSGKLGCDPRYVKKLSAEESAAIMAQVRESIGITEKKDPLTPELVALCANTTIHADADGWIKRSVAGCPISDMKTLVQLKGVNNKGEPWIQLLKFEANEVAWDEVNKHGLYVTHWRYANKEQ